MSLRGNRCIGILREVKYKWERRVPLVPQHVKELVNKHGVKVLVQPSDKRIFTNKEFEEAGAVLTEDLSPASTIIGVKEIPEETLIPDRSYLLFNHVIKAQAYNMSFLDACLKNNIRLFDYETIRSPLSDGGQRLVAFGHYAGLAGMVDILRGLGEHLLSRGHSTPFLEVGSAFMYGTVDNAKQAVQKVGEQIAKNGVSENLSPITFAFSGQGNVSKGAQEMFELLPHQMVDAKELKNLNENKNHNRFQVYATELQTSDIVAPIDAKIMSFEEQDYFDNPQNYKPIFHENVAPYTSVLVNGMYWDQKYPRLLTCDQLRTINEEHPGAFLGLADISCDIEGSVEFFRKSTQIESPFFTYDAEKDEVRDGIDGNGVVVLGVDILPSEFPRESSHHFSSALLPFIESLAASDGTKPFTEQKDLPEEFHNSCIASNGSLTPRFGYIQHLREEHAAEKRKSEAEREPVTSFILEGHIFDSGLINRVLDAVEFNSGRAKIVHWETGSTIKKPSRAVVQVSAKDHEQLRLITEDLHSLIRLTLQAAATLKELPYAAVKSQAMESPSSTVTSKGSTGGQRVTPPKQILLLGSGRTAGPVIEYLSKSGTNTITIGSNDVEQARKLAEGNVFVIPKYIDASDLDTLSREIENSHIVISLLPASRHIAVASLCLKHHTDLVTASYVSPEMKDLDQKAKNAKITFLNEVGLDPGIDHMSAMKIIHETQAKGEEIVSFESNCGGLPAPEAAGNPLGYKFSWSPMGVLSASQQSAVYKRDGKEISVDSKDLLTSAVPYVVNPAFNLETLPNRDSLSYSSLYGISDAKTMYRGTLRYRGFCEIMHGFRAVGLLSNQAPQTLSDEVGANSSWFELTSALSGSKSDDLPDAVRDLLYQNTTLSQESVSRTIGALNWLGMMSKQNAVSDKPKIVDSFCDLLEEKLSYGESERDMVLLHHRFGIKDKQGNNKQVDSTLLCYGEVGGHSAMAKTVGLPVGVCTQLLLDGEIRTKGVATPVISEIYEPCLEKLAKNGIEFDEQTQEDLEVL